MRGLHKRWWFWAGMLLAVFLVASVLKKGLKAVPVRTAKVQRAAMELTVSAAATGTVKAAREVELTLQRPGRLQKVLAEEGQEVDEGALVAQLDTREAELRLSSARAALEHARTVLGQLQQAYEPLRVEVESTIRRTEAQLKEAQWRLERLRRLFEKGFASEAELEAAERALAVQKAAYEAALSGRLRLQADARRIQAQEAKVKEARAALRQAELWLSYSYLRAPFRAVLASRPAKPGQYLPRGARVATLLDMDSLYIEAPLDEVDVAKVKEGQMVKLRIDAHPGRVFSGRVFMVAKTVRGGGHEARTFLVRVRPTEDIPGLRPGMSADVEVVVKTITDALVVPASAVFQRNGGRYVYVRQGSRARLQRLRIGASSWEHMEVLQGLREGQEVIITPDVPGLAPGARIKVSHGPD
jgi:multidrug resistance efflux pump